MALTRSSQLALPPFKGSGISSSLSVNGLSRPNVPSIVGFRAPIDNLSRSAGSFSSNNASSAPSSPLLMWENMGMGNGMGMGQHEWPPNTMMEPVSQCHPIILSTPAHHAGESPSIDSSSCCYSAPISGLSRIPSLASLNTASSSSTSSNSAPALVSDPISPLADVVTQYIVFNEEEEEQQQQQEQDGSRKSTERENNSYGMQACWDALLHCEGTEGDLMPLYNNGFAGLTKAQTDYNEQPLICSNELEQILNYVSTQEMSRNTSVHAGSVLRRTDDEYHYRAKAEPNREGISSRKRAACNRLEELEDAPDCKSMNIGSTTTAPIPLAIPVGAGRNNTNNNNNKQRRRNGTAMDPQSVAARMRRERFSERIRILQGLVPKGERLDTVSMLGQTLEYVRFLQHRVSELYHTTSAAAAAPHSSLTPAQRNKWKDFLEEPLMNP